VVVEEQDGQVVGRRGRAGAAVRGLGVVSHFGASSEAGDELILIPSARAGQILFRHIRMAHLHQEILKPLHLVPPPGAA
jgi:hypothetical protein